jgi:hypothetical protein
MALANLIFEPAILCCIKQKAGLLALCKKPYHYLM